MNDDEQTTKTTNDDYRRVLATASKLESIQANLDSVIDFFLAPIVKLYTKLCNDCLKLLFESEFKLDHFRKAEELVWRRVYHDIYRFHKTKRQAIRKTDESFIEAHFIAGIGFYSSLVIRLRSHYNIHDTRGIIAPLNLTLGPIDNLANNQRLNQDDPNHQATNDNPMLLEENSANSAVSSPVRQWARQAIYRSLIYMGDLARYLQETSDYDYRRMAFGFYQSASRFQPEHGLPFNQLATLAGGVNHNLDAVCSYMRCCMRAKPFEGAEGNMRKIFELNKRFYEEISEHFNVLTISQISASNEPLLACESMVRATIVIFIKLASDLWMAINNPKTDDLQDQILEETRLFFMTLCESIELDPSLHLDTITVQEQEFCPLAGKLAQPDKPRYLSPTIMYEFCSISLMLSAKCQRQRSLGIPTQDSSPDDKIMDLVNTVALNLLHYATSRCQKMIQKRVGELKGEAKDLGPIGTNTIKKPTDKMNSHNFSVNLPNIQIQENPDNKPETVGKRTQSRLRQRKAASNYSNQVDKFRTLNYNNEESELSDLEETALSTIDALDISSGMSEGPDCEANDLIDLCSSSDDNLLEFKSSNFNNTPTAKLSRPALRSTRSQNYELERTMNLAASSSSLPVPDLLTGDLGEQLSYNITNNSQSPSSSSMEGVRTSNFGGAGSLGGTFCSRPNEFVVDKESIYSGIYNHTYLPIVKVYFDWILSNGAIINSNLLSFHGYKNVLETIVSLLGELNKLLDERKRRDAINTLFPATIDSGQEVSQDKRDHQRDEDSQIYKHIYDGPEWIQKYPLSCDFPLIGLEPISGVHELNIDFNHPNELKDSEAGFITTQCVAAFSHALTVFLDNNTF